MRNLVAILTIALFAASSCIDIKPTPTPTPPVITVPDDQFIKGVFALTNSERQSFGLPTLKWNNKLGIAAQKYAELMAARGTMSHEVDGQTLRMRVDDVGYSWSTIGENIASGYKTPESVMRGWMGSAGHRANILDDDFTEIGVGAKGRYQCQIFGKPKELRRVIIGKEHKWLINLM